MIQDLYKQKRSLELKWQQEHLSNDRYTLEMVRIDDKVKQVITEIKLEEAAIAHRQNSDHFKSVSIIRQMLLFPLQLQGPFLFV